MTKSGKAFSRGLITTATLTAMILVSTIVWAQTPSVAEMRAIAKEAYIWQLEAGSDVSRIQGGC